MKYVLLAIVVAVLMGAAGIIGFNAGAASGKAQVENSPVSGFQRSGGSQSAPGGAGFQPGQGGAGFQPGQGGVPGAGQGGQFAGQGARPVSGTIKSVEGDTVIVTEANGSTITVKLDKNTSIQKTATASPGEIQAGVRITVTGDTSGGTVTARTIQVGAAGQ